MGSRLFQLAPFLGIAVALPFTPDSLSSTTGLPWNSTVSNSTMSNSTSHNLNVTADASAASAWWYPNIDHSTGAVRDYVPNLGSDYDYPVYIAVDSGDSQGFINALTSNGPNGARDNMWIAGEPRTIYLAPGTYSLSETMYLDTDTVIIGDAINPPTIQAASGFSGSYLIVGGQGDDQSGGGESHFSVSIRNVILDTTQNAGTSDFTALEWRVAQNSALNNVQINMPSGAHTGKWVGDLCINRVLTIGRHLHGPRLYDPGRRCQFLQW